MAANSRLEEQVFLQLDELRRLRTENEQLHLKNKLLLAQLGDRDGTVGQKQPQQDSRVDATTSSANAETLKLREQVGQLQGVIERLRDDLEDNESQKMELQMEVERLREALEEAEAQITTNLGGTSKVMGAMGNSSVLRQKDELSDLEHELNKKARVLEDKQVALLNKEGQLREWEIRLSAKEAELQLQAIAPPRKDALEGPASGNGVSFGSMGYAGVGADSASLQGTFGSAVGADRKLQFEIAKRKHQEDLEREKIEEIAMESPSGVKEGLHQSKRRMMAMKEDIAIEENRPSFSQIDPGASRPGQSSHVSQASVNQSRRTYEYIKPRKTEDLTDSHKLTFDSKVRGEPSRGERSQVYQSKIGNVSEVEDPFSGNHEKLDNNWIERPPEDFDHSAEEGDRRTSPHQDDHRSFELNDAAFPKESSLRDAQKAIKAPSDEGDEATEPNSNPDNSVNKKAVAFDLFDDKIDEKRRQTLIQKLERNRGATAEKRAAAVAAAQIEKAKNPAPEGKEEGYLSRHRANNPQAQAPMSNNFLGGISDKSQNPSGVATNSRVAPPTQPNRWASDQTNPEDNVRGKVPIIQDKTGDYAREGPRKIPSSPADRRMGRPERLDLGADISPKPMTGHDSRKSVGLSSNKKPDANKAGQNDPSKQGLRNSSARKKTFGSSSNRKNLSNAIMSVLLAGTTNDLQRMDVLSILAKSQHSNFVILFKNTGRQTFQGLYAFDEEGDVVKLYGLDRLPATIADHQVATYYKYSSGSKQFTPIPGNKALSIAVDAVELKQVGPSKK